MTSIASLVNQQSKPCTEWDGYRCAMQIAPDGTTRLTSRNGNDFTAEFAELAGVLAPALDGRAAVLDGEIVVYNEAGQPEFGMLQERCGRYQTHRASLRRDEPFTDLSVRFLAFDLLQLGEESLLRAPYDERRERLLAVPMPDPYRVAVVRAFTFIELDADRRTTADLLAHVTAAGHEGLVAKHRRAPYTPGKRTDAWLKHPLTQANEVIICGWRPGQGRFTGTVGGLLLGAHDPGSGKLRYIGDVGTGFSDAERSRLHARLEELHRPEPPFADDPPCADVARARWVEPVLVGEVEFRQVTRGSGRLRHTAWRGLRADKTPGEVLAPRPDREPETSSPPDEPAAAGSTRPHGLDEPSRPLGAKITVRAGARQLTLSNLDKPLYPSGFTKGEVIHYYSHIAPLLLPHLAGRPITVIRFPDGVGGEQFFEKNVPRGGPEWLPTVPLPSTSGRSRHGERGEHGEPIEYPLIDELAGLVWAANMAALEIHVPQYTVDPGPPPLRRAPDRLVFDLDPGPETSIVDCCRVAERLQDVLAADGLTAFPKTSGSKGMQLYCSIDTADPAAPSAYAKRLAQRLARETPDRVIAVMSKTQRIGRVLIDWSQNNIAKTTIAPYSLRGRDQPTVSTPIAWDAVHACRHPAQLVFTADDVLGRVAEHGDLLASLGSTRAPLPTD
ncbi:DNA ligase D [Amycolatopsis coloradensis]|uniref:DNA ligase (ATP) n=1 Tax=Amycolatopsis coloradensis TaxID=76021 RepID=A0A1R0KDT7_9PSEU|nr:DNA ligase D [Amycolatopsis coloradensis]OLZ43157.1 DNA ligase D [Amycolatopsis coloradensis]